MEYTILNRDDLREDGGYREFEGYLNGTSNTSFILVDVPPGEGPRLHRHPYEELFFVLEGQATYTVGTQQVEVTAGQIVITGPDVPHAFVNSGTGILRQVDIHVSPQFVTEWLED